MLSQINIFNVVRCEMWNKMFIFTVNWFTTNSAKDTFENVYMKYVTRSIVHCGGWTDSAYQNIVKQFVVFSTFWLAMPYYEHFPTKLKCSAKVQRILYRFLRTMMPEI